MDHVLLWQIAAVGGSTEHVAASSCNPDPYNQGQWEHLCIQRQNEMRIVTL